MKTSRRFLSLVIAFAVSAVAAGAQTPSTSQSAKAFFGRPRDRRRRRSTATLGCGLCRPPRCWRTVSGRAAGIGAARTSSRATPTSATSRGRWPWGSRTAPRSSARSSSTRGSTATTSAPFSERPGGGRVRGSVSAGEPGLDREPRRRPRMSARRSTCGRSSGRTRRRSRCAASSSCRRRIRTSATGRARPTSSSTSSAARTSRRSWSGPATRATRSGASRTDSTRRGGRSVGHGGGLSEPQPGAPHGRIDRPPAVERHGDPADRPRGGGGREHAADSSLTPRTSDARATVGLSVSGADGILPGRRVELEPPAH